MTDSPETGNPETDSPDDGVLGLPEPGPSYTLQQFPEKLAVINLPPGAEIPSWAESSSLLSITATATETSVVCAGRSVPTKVVAEKGLFGFALQGAAGHDRAGVLVALLAPLAEEGISVFSISTYQSIWILVSSRDAEKAAEAWRRHGHTVAAAVPVKPSRKSKR